MSLNSGLSPKRKPFYRHIFSGLLAGSLLLAACAPAASVVLTLTLPPPQVNWQEYTLTPSVTPSPQPSLTPTPNLLVTLTPTLSPTSTLSPTPTTDPFADWYIDALRARTYGGGLLQDAGNLPSGGSFSRKLFRYRSEGLNLYGFINIPAGQGPFPVVVMLHGYVSPGAYSTLAYSTRYADALTEAGFVVLHPNLRGYRPSASAPNFLGIGDTLDVLNLINLLRVQAGKPGFLQKVDASRLGLWGHSMGGGIVLRALLVDAEIDAAVLYAALDADESVNLAHFEDDGRGNEQIEVPPAALERISPSTFIDEIQTPLSLHHGDADLVVPAQWSVDLCARLEELGIEHECVLYPDQPHTFQNAGDAQFSANVAEFFSRHLKRD